jgi:hypothetical protein
LHAAEQHFGIAPAVGVEDLADQRFLDAAGDADAGAVDVAAENRPGAVRAVALLVAVARTGEILLDNLDALKRRMILVDAGVEDGDDDAGAGKR